MKSKTKRYKPAAFDPMLLDRGRYPMAGLKPATDHQSCVNRRDPTSPAKRHAARTFEPWSLVHLQVSGGSNQPFTATVMLIRGEKTVQDACTGDEPLSAISGAIHRLTKTDGNLKNLSARIAPSPKNAACWIDLTVNLGGHAFYGQISSGANILENFALAYLNAVNQFLWDKTERKIKKRRNNCLPI